MALLRPIHPLVEYYANQDFFANVLCINKDKPEMACNGKCILMQKLKRVSAAATDPSPDDTPPQKINLTEDTIEFIQLTPDQIATLRNYIYKELIDNHCKIT